MSVLGSCGGHRREMQATTFRLGALVALVGALPAPLDDASDIARLTIKKHKKHHSLEPSMHDEAFDVAMERRRVDCAEDEKCCSIKLQAKFEGVLENSGEKMCWDIRREDVPGHHACEHFAFLHEGRWAHCQPSGDDLAGMGIPCTYISTGWFTYPGISNHGIGARRHAYCPEEPDREVSHVEKHLDVAGLNKKRLEERARARASRQRLSNYIDQYSMNAADAARKKAEKQEAAARAGLRRKVSFQLTPKQEDSAAASEAEQEAREAALSFPIRSALKTRVKELKEEENELREEFDSARFKAEVRPKQQSDKDKYQEIKERGAHVTVGILRRKAQVLPTHARARLRARLSPHPSNGWQEELREAELEAEAYETLGLPETATAAEIEQKYEELLRTLPDDEMQEYKKAKTIALAVAQKREEAKEEADEEA